MINTIEIESQSRQKVQHKLYLDEQGKAVGCSCESRVFHPWTPCKHMVEWNQQKALAAAIINSCITCGRNTKQVICGRCLE